MRIQHNIPAMSSYRNYTNNTSAVAKNLEKLSSGYKINRAGDDAAGLAISEKMRIQITGLEQAQTNAKAGINLVQTAEGALTEVNSMLTRMYTLAEQSANGTYQNEVDREQLQKEVESLRSEINRIADSTNYNGIKLLDGSLSAEGTEGTKKTVTADVSKLSVDVRTSAVDISAVKGQYSTGTLLVDATGNKLSDMTKNDRINLTVTFEDKDGEEQTVELSLIMKDTKATEAGKTAFVLDDGTEDGIKLNTTLAAAATLEQDELGAVLEEAMKKSDVLKENFSLSYDADTTHQLKFDALEAGSAGAVLKDVKITFVDNEETDPKDKYTDYAQKVTTVTTAEDGYKVYDFSKAQVWDNTDVAKESGKHLKKDLEDAIFEVNGKKFVFVNDDLTTENKQALEAAGVEHWVKVGTSGSATTGDNAVVAAADIKNMVEKIEKETGLELEQGEKGTNGTWGENSGKNFIRFKDGTVGKDGAAGGGLRMQIGDTAEAFNQVTVSVNDMHTKAMKYVAKKDATEFEKAADGMTLADIDISTQDGAAKAMAVIKNATNYVSDTRGTLGALQNRLDHTINSLSVSQQNIQDAESTIRDTDVAREMMEYTKNSILVQSAQAMLAQANQLPQGVLQLLG